MEEGNGKERKDRLTVAGYDYYEVQRIVNNMLKWHPLIPSKVYPRMLYN